LEVLDEAERIVVHFDVDTVDYMDLPISENAGRSEGLTFDTTMRALRVLLTTPKLGGFTLTEVNPDHDPDGSAARRLAEGLAAALSTAEERT
jgi:arginase